jgi:pyruvate/2-oxoglutarate/acetoin dehydrogenase E1 component
VAPFKSMRAGLVQTRLPGTRDKVLDKAVGTTGKRLTSLGSALVGERRVTHDARAIAGALRELTSEGCDIFLIAGASAIVDRHDVVPAGIEEAGGKVTHFGMPVDPGNLLLTAELDGKPVLGLPGCAKSPKYNGFDMVLERLAAGLPIGRAEIVREGTDVSVLTYGTMVHVAMTAAAETGIDAEIIDLRTLLPLDLDSIQASVCKTGRCVIVHEATLTSGFGAELSALVQETCFYHLEAPIVRVAGWDTPYPHAQEWDYFPDPGRVGRALLETMAT